ncbi:MAG: hypothetical protein SNI70_10180 [Rikenellaceae bacterium]
MNRELLEELHVYFEEIAEPTHEEDRFHQRLRADLEYFPITFLHREDLASRGFDAEEVDDCTMRELADKMGRAYQEGQYWEDVEILAREVAEKFHCPKCLQEIHRYERYGQIFSCLCGHEWSIN